MLGTPTADLISDQAAMWIIGGLLSAIWGLGQALALAKLGQLKDALTAHASEELARDSLNADKVADALKSLSSQVRDLTEKVSELSNVNAQLSEWRLSVDRRLDKLEAMVENLSRLG